MSNTYFRFKQFTVHQEHCAMKVCTDACLFGAWVADGINRWGSEEPSHILDIGTGTGLLSLMLAQKTNAGIDAVELDEKAAEQAGDNFESTQWKKQLQVIQADIRTVHLGRKYDFILSNPPFFEHDLKSENEERNLALHSKELSFLELLKLIKQWLSDKGKFALLLPAHRKAEFIQLAAVQGFYPEEILMVKQTPTHDFFRVILLFSGTGLATKYDEIIIRENDQYSNEFTQLLQEYYLYL